MKLSPMKYSSRAAQVRGSQHNQKRGRVRIGVNVTTDQLERIRSLAVAEGYSVAGAIRHLIDVAMETPGRPGYRDPLEQERIR